MRESPSLREFARPPQALSLLLRGVATSLKRPGRVDALTGATRVLSPVAIDARHLERYLALCGFPVGPLIPLTYPQILAFPLTLDYLVSADCPWPAVGTVQLANRIEQLEPLVPGASLRIELAPGSLLAHPKGQAFTLEIRILRNGRPVWRATQMLLRRGVLDPVGPSFETALSDLSTPPFDPLASDITTGLNPVATFDVPADIGRRYAPVSGDFNPIHLSVITARLFGFRRAIGHGLWSLARALAILEPLAGSRPATLSTLFMAPVWLPASVSLWCDTGERRDGSAMRFELRDARGERVHLRACWSTTPS